MSKSKLFTTEQILSSINLEELGESEFKALYSSFTKEQSRRLEEEKKKRIEEEYRKSESLLSNIDVLLAMFDKHEPYKKCLDYNKFSQLSSSYSEIDGSSYCIHCILKHIKNKDFSDIFIKSIEFKFIE